MWNPCLPGASPWTCPVTRRPRAVSLSAIVPTALPCWSYISAVARSAEAACAALVTPITEIAAAIESFRPTVPSSIRVASDPRTRRAIAD